MEADQWQEKARKAGEAGEAGRWHRPPARGPSQAQRYGEHTYERRALRRREARREREKRCRKRGLMGANSAPKDLESGDEPR